MSVSEWKSTSKSNSRALVAELTRLGFCCSVLNSIVQNKEGDEMPKDGVMPERHLEVTHIFPRPPVEGRWVPIVFLTRDMSLPSYHFLGWETMRSFTDVEVEAMTDAHEIEPVVLPIGKGLWLSSDGTIWLANETRPINDPDKVRIRIRI